MNTRERRKPVSNEQPEPGVIREDGHPRSPRRLLAAPSVDSDYPGLARDYAHLLAHIDNSAA
ncbi:hypothetical protein [Deinococcus pimensis]|uniref:hypothetical protein n=1 Tax=Deinococcus pimensis TaxID=309888 RepID=UPI000489907F|nr:hypothetical protein [Deinococcus pimensis]